MAHWLLKSEPDEWSWAEQVAKGRDGAEWTGIRNFSARNHLRAMKKGEQAFFYHTGKERAIVGIVRVIAKPHPDSTDSAWSARRTNASRAWCWSGWRACRSSSYGGRVADRLPDGGTRLNPHGERVVSLAQSRAW